MLLGKGMAIRIIANGEATYILKDGMVSYSARKLDSDDVQSEIREIKLTRVKQRNIRKLRMFFAQCDVDVITNYPLPGPIPREESGYGINTYPYYTLAYYANSKNYLKGFFVKMRTSDKEILTKLRTL